MVKGIWLRGIGAGTISLLLACLLALIIQNNSPCAIKGLTVMGTHVGGLNAEQIELLLQDEEKKLAERQVTLIYSEGENRLLKMSTNQLGIIIDKTSMLTSIFSVGKGFQLSSFKERWLAYRGVLDIPWQLSLEEERAQECLREIAFQWDHPPENAQLQITENEQVIILPDKKGSKLDLNSAQEILAQLKAKDLWDDVPIVLPVVELSPDLTTEDIESWKITGSLAKAETDFNSQNLPRTNNIVLASAKIDGYCIAPGEIFSFNEVVGPRTEENGYQEAMIIVDNQFEPGLGGGVCQVSSTLYNAVLAANLSIEERRRHNLLVDYVPPGLDATVAYGYIDFRFKNNTNGYLLLKAEVGQGKLIITVFGEKEGVPKVVIGRQVEKVLPPPTVYHEDNTLPAKAQVIIKKGAPGYIVKVTRETFSEGKLISQEIVSRDIYQPVSQIVKLGPGAKP